MLMPSSSQFSPYRRTLLLSLFFILIIMLNGCQTTTGMQTGDVPSDSRTPTSDSPSSQSQPPPSYPSPIEPAPSEKTQVTVTTAPTTPKDSTTIEAKDTQLTEEQATSPAIDETQDNKTPSSDQPSFSTPNNNPDLENPSIEEPSLEDSEQGTEVNPNLDSDANVATPSETDNIFDSNSTTPSPDTTPPSATTPVIPVPDNRTPQQILVDLARQNSQNTGRNTTTIADGNDIPAFRRLMNTGVKQLKQGKLSAAQSTFTRAQRLAPQSSAVYFYLGQVALKQNQPLKAEAMARRGLVVAQDKSRKTSLWQLILKSGQLRNNKKVIDEAKQALAQ